jgi:hypothetical protein
VEYDTARSRAVDALFSHSIILPLEIGSKCGFGGCLLWQPRVYLRVPLHYVIVQNVQMGMALLNAAFCRICSILQFSTVGSSIITRLHLMDHSSLIEQKSNP